MQPPDRPEPFAPPTDDAPGARPPTTQDRSVSPFRSVHEVGDPESPVQRKRWRWVAIPVATGVGFVALAGFLASQSDDDEPASDGAVIQDEYAAPRDQDAVVEELPVPTDDAADVSIGDAAVVRSDLAEPAWEDDLLGEFGLCGPSTLADRADESARVAFMQIAGDESTATVRQLTSVVLSYPTAGEASSAVNADLDRTGACPGPSTLPSGATYDATAREGLFPERIECSDLFASTIIELRNPDEDTPYIGQRRSFTQCGRFVALTAYLITDPDDSFEHPDVSRAETVVTERFVELVEDG